MTQIDRHSPSGVPWLCLTKRVGQLGNRLFLSAHVLGLARQTGARLANVALAEYADSFLGSQGQWWPDASLPEATSETFLQPTPRLLEPTAGRRRLLASLMDATARLVAGGVARGPQSPRVPWWPWPTMDISQSHDSIDAVFPLESLPDLDCWKHSRGIFLRGWKFRLTGGLEPHREFLIRYFQPVSTVADGVNRALQQARQQGDIVLGIHVRRGDYREWLGGKYFFDHAQYAEWMRQAPACWPGRKISYLVCSNEPYPESWRGEFSVSSGPGDAIGDLYALAGCDALLAPPSSFALWASFIGKTPLHMVESADKKLHPVSFTFHPGA